MTRAERDPEAAAPHADEREAGPETDPVEAIGAPELAMRLRAAASWLEGSSPRALADPPESRADVSSGLAGLLDLMTSALQRLESASPTLIVCGALRLDVVRRSLSWREGTVQLRTRECEALAYLMKRPEQIVTYRDLRRDVWRLRDDVNTNVVHVTLCALRKKLAACRGALRLANVRGVGVILKASLDETSCP